MKIAYLENPFDHSRLNAGGVSKYIIKALQENSIEVLPISLKKKPIRYYWHALYAKMVNLVGKKYQAMRSPSVWKKVSKSMAAELEKQQFDAVLSFGSLPIACFPTEKPIFFWTDAVFESLVDYYPDHTQLLKKAIANGHYLDALAIERASTAFFCTHIEINQAKKYYNAPANIMFAPFGGNLDNEPSEQEVKAIIEKKKIDVVKLLMIGWDWNRKGGDKATAIVRQLNMNKIPAELHIIGMEQREGIKDEFIFFHGKIDKATDEGKKEFDKLLSEASYLVHFSKAETYGHVLCEANAYGVPAITSDTGGIMEVIADGKNGQKFSNDTPIQKIADYIVQYTNNLASYRELCLSSYNEYKTRLNWNTAVKIVIRQIREVVER